MKASPPAKQSDTAVVGEEIAEAKKAAGSKLDASVSGDPLKERLRSVIDKIKPVQSILDQASEVRSFCLHVRYREMTEFTGSSDSKDFLEGRFVHHRCKKCRICTRQYQ